MEPCLAAPAVHVLVAVLISLSVSSGGEDNEFPYKGRLRHRYAQFLSLLRMRLCNQL